MKNSRYFRMIRGAFVCGTAFLLMLLTCGLAACAGGTSAGTETDSSPVVTHPSETGGETQPPESDAPAESGGPTEAESETPPEPDTTPVTEPATEAETFPVWEGEANAKTVNKAAELANGVTAYYTGVGGSAFAVENRNVILRYDMTDRGSARISELTSKAGAAYFKDSGDSYVLLSDGGCLYASGTSARANVFDQGFYYYDVHIFDQTFMGPDAVASETVLEPSRATGFHDMVKLRKPDGDWMEYRISDPADPYILFNNLKLNTAEVDAILITLRSTVSTEGYLYFSAGPHDSYNDAQKLRFTIQNDGEFHTVTIPMSAAADYTGLLTGVRFDIGSAKDEIVAIRSIRAVSYRTDLPAVSLDRNFIAYSDKLNDVTRFIATANASGVSALGTEYRIPSDTVDKLVIVDAAGQHDSLSDADLTSIVSVGLDIRDAGVFGVILLDDGSGAKLTVEESDGCYIIRQQWDCASGSLRNAQEVTIGRRLYTDEGHDFTAFLYEAYCERNPLTGVKVLNESTGRTYYAGYNALRGVYEFMVESGADFSALYNDPDHQYPVMFSIEGGDADRRIWVMSHTTKGWLECAALLDESNRMLPVRLEVCKNFAGDGEEPFYTHNDSVAYGYTVFPMIAEAGTTERLTVVHLYERWGVFRLKQLSSIRFHQAYYHQSLGVTETNCIAFYNTGNRLPDHRGLSQPYWEDQLFGARDAAGNPVGPQTRMVGGGPEHENTGSHTFLRYIDADGTSVTTDSRAHDIDSSGPTYYDITMHYVTTDGKMTADIRHAEMPQYDENRAYTQLDYEVLDTVTIKSFKSDFEIYGITSSKPGLQYTRLGYLDADGQPQIVDANDRPRANVYTLAREYPYFDYFRLQDPNPGVYDSSDLYSNVSVLVKGWDIVIGGQRYEGPLIISEKEYRTVLTLDLDGVTLLPGDHIRVDLILMPWGGYGCEDDENVRLVRENTLVHPILLTSGTDTVLTSDPWIPKVRSADGKTAVFTISGGCDNIDRTGTASEGNTIFKTYYDRDFNVVVRVYGLRDFGTAGIYEQIDGAWVPVPLASVNGYDGYAILYDEDHSFSVSFVVNMNDARPRTFRVVIE